MRLGKPLRGGKDLLSNTAEGFADSSSRDGVRRVITGDLLGSGGIDDMTFYPTLVVEVDSMVSTHGIISHSLPL